MIIKDQNFLSDAKNISHGFFTKQGGVSKGIYASLNCGPGSHDNPDHVNENRKRVAEEMSIDARNLLSLYQVHGSTCFYIDKPFEKRPQADAYVTDQPGLGLGILTADCAPVLFYGEKQDGAPVIGAAHSGWGGAFKGVLSQTVKMMEERGALLDSIRAAVGPTIGPKSYEVSNDFSDKFLEQDESNEHFFKPASKKGHLMFDLPGYISKRLAKAGVKHVSISDFDTYSDEERFFSYRRTVHNDQEDYGRQISVITIQK